MPGLPRLAFLRSIPKLHCVNSNSYAAAGVNIDLGESLKRTLPALVRQTHRPEVLGSIGGFGGLFAINLKKHKRPVLVSSMDGVGTKLKVAVQMNRHDTVGQDLVNHCVNDIAVLGAEPLFFLDYIGMGKLAPQVFHQIIAGLAKACREAGCALIGGETAQMPGMYAAGDYDLVSTIVGVVERDQIVDGKKIRPGDVIIGLASTGLHTNGYSLAREILFAKMRVRLDDYCSRLGTTYGEELLKVHRNYWPLIKKLRQPGLHGMAHITGGGFYDNIPRVLPAKCTAVVKRGTWDGLPIFQMLHESGVTEEEMYRVFNMGIGMTLVVDPAFAPVVHKTAKRVGIPAYTIGEIRKGRAEVIIE